MLSACSPRIHTRGNLPDVERVEELKPGDITKEEVAEILGSPSTVASFGNEAWLYISERTETLAWFHPEVMERNVLVLEFDKEGVLVEKMQVGLDAANKVIPSDRRTPTHGNKLTAIEQLVGNFRRFTGGQ
jgi:outer membrane protein assembly factor BamE (lipoprotein component of BamABCDE complex)